MTRTHQISVHHLLRKVALGWRYGALSARLVTAVAIVATFAAAAAAWQTVRSEEYADRLSAPLAKMEAARAVSAAAIQAAVPTDVAQTLPPAPIVSQVVQTLQQVADKEGAHLMSLQAEDHPPTAIALGHLDLALSIKAQYPSILVVIQQVLDRYPGAALRQMLVTPVTSASPTRFMAAPASAGASAVQTTTESEAHLTLAFWRRPLGVEGLALDAAEPPASVAISVNASASGATALAASAGASVASMAVTSTPGAIALPPIAVASSGLRN